MQVGCAPLVFGPGPGDQRSASYVSLPPSEAPGDVSSTSGSDCPHVVAKVQDVNPGPSVTLNAGALSAPSRNSRVVRKQVGRMVVQPDPPPKPRKPCIIKQKRRGREVLTSSRWFYDPLGTWPSFAERMSDVSVGEHGPGTREASCGPSLYVDQCLRTG